MRLKITVLPGEGVGPEVTREAVRVLRTVEDLYGHDFQFEERLIGAAALEACGTRLPRETVEACLASDAVLLGALDEGAASPQREEGLHALHAALGVEVSLRPFISYGALADCSPLREAVVRGADVLVVEGARRAGQPPHDAAGEASRGVRPSEGEAERVARAAFRAASARRGRLTSVERADFDGDLRLWRGAVARVAVEYPGVRLEYLDAGSCLTRLLTNPQSFDVILDASRGADTLACGATAIIGAPGVMASASLGGGAGCYMPEHGPAFEVAGCGMANPLGAVAAAALLLRYGAGLEQEARDVEQAFREVLDAGYRTPDIHRGNGKYIASTSEIGSLVAEAVAGVVDLRHAYHAV